MQNTANFYSNHSTHSTLILMNKMRPKNLWARIVCVFEFYISNILNAKKKTNVLYKSLSSKHKMSTKRNCRHFFANCYFFLFMH